MKYIGKYKGNVGTTHGTLVSGLVGYYNRIINLSKYLIGGNFTTYSPNVNLYEDQKDSILIARTYNGSGSGSGYEDPPFNGLTNNIVVTLDNSTKIDPEFSVMKINRKNSNVSQMDYVSFPRYDIEPGKIMEMSFWYYGTYGTAINIYALDAEVYVERWDAFTNAYITNNSSQCSIPVTTNTWQYIKVRATNTHATLSKRGITWVILHDNLRRATLSNTEYWKITCVKLWYVESITKNKIIRLNDDGSIDNTWYNNNSYTSGSIYDLKYDNINKKVYAAGDPALEGGLVRYNLNGTKDNSFNIGTGFDNYVSSIGLDTINQKIFVVGNFTTFKGITRNRIIKLNLDGSRDTSFHDSNFATGFNGWVNCITIDNINQKTYVGGIFGIYNEIDRNRLIRLHMNGTIDYTFKIGSGFNGEVYSIALDNINQKIYVGGGFNTYNGNTQNSLIRLNMDGSKDTSFDVSYMFAGGGGVRSIVLDTINKKIYAGGDFTRYYSDTQNRLVRLNMDGTKDTSFNIGTGFDGRVRSIALDTINQKIFVGGDFTAFNGVTRNKLARLNMDGSLDTSFNIGLNNNVNTILKYTV